MLISPCYLISERIFYLGVSGETFCKAESDSLPLPKSLTIYPISALTYSKNIPFGAADNHLPYSVYNYYIWILEDKGEG